MKKKVIIFLLVVIISGCSSNENKKVLNVFNWSSYIPNSVIRDFEKETNIKVNYSTYSSNEECLAKISNSKDGTYDLIFPSDYMIEIMRDRALLEKIDISKLKNYTNYDKQYLNLPYDKNNAYSLPFVVATTVISVNRKYVRDDITSYNDLLNSKYKGEIVLIDDQRIIIGMALLANGYDMNSTNKDELRIAKEWLKKLNKNIKAYDSDSPKNFLITEEAIIGVLWNAEAALAKEANNSIENIFPKEGFAISIDNFAIPKGAKNKDELYKFIDYILRPEVMAKIINSYPYKNINSKANLLLEESYLSNNASNIPNEVISHGIFVKNIGAFAKKYDRVWVEIK